MAAVLRRELDLYEAVLVSPTIQSKRQLARTVMEYVLRCTAQQAGQARAAHLPKRDLTWAGYGESQTGEMAGWLRKPIPSMEPSGACFLRSAFGVLSSEKGIAELRVLDAAYPTHDGWEGDEQYRRDVEGDTEGGGGDAPGEVRAENSVQVGGGSDEGAEEALTEEDVVWWLPTVVEKGDEFERGVLLVCERNSAFGLASKVNMSYARCTRRLRRCTTAATQPHDRPSTTSMIVSDM